MVWGILCGVSECPSRKLCSICSNHEKFKLSWMKKHIFQLYLSVVATLNFNQNHPNRYKIVKFHGGHHLARFQLNSLSERVSCSEPSQPKRIISGWKTKKQTSIYLLVLCIHSTSHFTTSSEKEPTFQSLSCPTTCQLFLIIKYI